MKQYRIELLKENFKSYPFVHISNYAVEVDMEILQHYKDNLKKLSEVINKINEFEFVDNSYEIWAGKGNTNLFFKIKKK